MMPQGNPLPLCWLCKHFDAEQQLKTGEFRCKAFPIEVPVEIAGDLLGYWFDHRTPHPDDKGIQFEELRDFEQLKQRRPFLNVISEESIEMIRDRVFEVLDMINDYRESQHPDE